jgi:hypothetical protein
VVSSTPRPHFTPRKDPVPILQQAGWAPVPVWTGGKSRPRRDFFFISAETITVYLGNHGKQINYNMFDKIILQKFRSNSLFISLFQGFMSDARAIKRSQWLKCPGAFTISRHSAMDNLTSLPSSVSSRA